MLGTITSHETFLADITTLSGSITDTTALDYLNKIIVEYNKIHTDLLVIKVTKFPTTIINNAAADYTTLSGTSVTPLANTDPVIITEYFEINDLNQAQSFINLTNYVNAFNAIDPTTNIIYCLTNLSTSEIFTELRPRFFRRLLINKDLIYILNSKMQNLLDQMQVQSIFDITTYNGSVTYDLDYDTLTSAIKIQERNGKYYIEFDINIQEEICKTFDILATLINLDWKV